MPFADYEDFAACERANSEKRDSGAYCAAIERATKQLDGEPESVEHLGDLDVDADALDELASETASWVADPADERADVWIDTAEGYVIYQARTDPGFGVRVYRIVQDDDEGPGEVGDILGVAVDMPTAGVYVDWNIDAWPDDEQLSGPHVSEYDSLEDARQVSEGNLELVGSDSLTQQAGVPTDAVVISGLSQEAREYIERTYRADVIEYQQEVPDDAVSISDRDEAPEDAQVVTGPRGGLYYTPEDSDSRDDTPPDDPSNVTAETADEYFKANFDDVDVTDLGDQKIIDFDTFPGIDYPIKSSIIVNEETDTLEEGDARLGEIDPSEIEGLEMDDSQISRAWSNIASETGMTDHDQIEVDIGDFDETILHLRVNEAFDRNQTDVGEFMEDFEQLRNVVAGISTLPGEEMENVLFDFESGFGVDNSTLRRLERTGEEATESDTVQLALKPAPFR